MGNSNPTLTTTAVTGPEETPHREKAGQTGRHPLPTHQQHHQTELSQRRNHPKTHPRNHHRWIQAQLMFNLDTLDVKQVAAALAGRTGYDHR